MSRLSMLTLIPGILLMAAGALLFWRPGWMAAPVARFPRNRRAGWVLLAVSVAGAAWMLHEMPLGRFEGVKRVLLPAAVALGFLVAVSMDELLAPRSLGALLLLYPAPLLTAVRAHDSRWSVVMAAVAYVMILTGLSLLLSPYAFRRASDGVFSSPFRCRVSGALAMAAGGGLIALAVACF